MVALAVRFLGQQPVVCNARPLLHKAAAALAKAHFIESGCLLREALRLYLAAEIEYHDVTISKRKVRQTPKAMLDALHRAEICGECQRNLIADCIDVGNRAAHCQFVRPCEIEDAICTMHWFLDEARNLVEPKAAGRLA